eukprot:1193298-Prorocentrum_minimum.AAC.1
MEAFANEHRHSLTSAYIVAALSIRLPTCSAPTSILGSRDSSGNVPKVKIVHLLHSQLQFRNVWYGLLAERSQDRARARMIGCVEQVEKLPMPGMELCALNVNMYSTLFFAVQDWLCRAGGQTADARHGIVCSRRQHVQYIVLRSARGPHRLHMVCAMQDLLVHSIIRKDINLLRCIAATRLHKMVEVILGW